MKTAKVGQMCTCRGIESVPPKTRVLESFGSNAKSRRFDGSGPWGGGGGILKEFLGGDVLLGHWNPSPIPELVQVNFAILD